MKNIDTIKYIDAVFFPYNDENYRIELHKSLTELRRFNMFKGFIADIKNDFNIGNIQLILKYIESVWANNNIDRYNYIINWFAHLLQNPQEKYINSLHLVTSKKIKNDRLLCWIVENIIGSTYVLECDKENNKNELDLDFTLLVISDGISDSKYKKYSYCRWIINIDDENDLSCYINNNHKIDLSNKLTIDNANIFYTYLLQHDLSNYNVDNPYVKSEVGDYSIYNFIRNFKWSTFEIPTGELCAMCEDALKKKIDSRIFSKELENLNEKSITIRTGKSRIKICKTL